MVCITCISHVLVRATWAYKQFEVATQAPHIQARPEALAVWHATHPISCDPSLHPLHLLHRSWQVAGQFAAQGGSTERAGLQQLGGPVVQPGNHVTQTHAATHAGAYRRPGFQGERFVGDFTVGGEIGIYESPLQEVCRAQVPAAELESKRSAMPSIQGGMFFLLEGMVAGKCLPTEAGLQCVLQQLASDMLLSCFCVVCVFIMAVNHCLHARRWL